MEPFRVHTGIAIPLDRPNVDTDQIIPKQFLKRIERTSFGQFLFYDWRTLPDGSPNPDFVLNDPRYAHAGVEPARRSILITGRNFGCGSSREHAVWALHDYGICAIIAPSFADIFANNALGNGLLPVALPEDQVQELMQRAQQPVDLTVDLETCEVRDGHRFRAEFTIDSFARHRLLNGLDDIGLTLQHEAAISAYERRAMGRERDSGK
jgi:3-isopropylmalate/(R)-2-methylmalate dehydratase small subunit